MSAFWQIKSAFASNGRKNGSVKFYNPGKEKLE